MTGGSHEEHHVCSFLTDQTCPLLEHESNLPTKLDHQEEHQLHLLSTQGVAQQKCSMHAIKWLSQNVCGISHTQDVFKVEPSTSNSFLHTVPPEHIPMLRMSGTWNGRTSDNRFVVPEHPKRPIQGHAKGSQQATQIDQTFTSNLSCDKFGTAGRLFHSANCFCTHFCPFHNCLCCFFVLFHRQSSSRAFNWHVDLHVKNLHNSCFHWCQWESVTGSPFQSLVPF